MANAHGNTKQTRLPIRTAIAIESEAEANGITIANMADRIVMEWLRANKRTTTLRKIDTLPEPRRALPPMRREQLLASGKRTSR
jgi:hypothetical protein